MLIIVVAFIARIMTETSSCLVNEMGLLLSPTSRMFYQVYF